MAAIAEEAQATSLALAGHLAVPLGIQVGSALTRFYRLLRHERIDDQRLTEPRLRVLHGDRARLLLAIDWTEWPHVWRILVAAAGGCGLGTCRQARRSIGAWYTCGRIARCRCTW
jgi:hypothetical protein